MAAKAIKETPPIHASHLGVPKSKAEKETSTQPSASAKCIAIPDPLPSNTWVNTAIGSANNRTIDPRNPRGDRMPEPPTGSCCPTLFGGVRAPPRPTLRGYSVITRTSSLLPLWEGLARQLELYGAESCGTPVELPVLATGFSYDDQ